MSRFRNIFSHFALNAIVLLFLILSLLFGCEKFEPKRIVKIATVTTTSISNITENSAQSGGNISNDGGATVTARGVCWSTSSNPTTADSKSTDGSGTGTFTSSLTGLSPGTTYYVRAYATNSVGTAYGNEVSFTTNQPIPTVVTYSIDNITNNSATSGGAVSYYYNVTATGVCWSTSQNPTVINNHTNDSYWGGNDQGTFYFTSSITGLSPVTTYYVRAYASSSAGTIYGNEKNFTTEQTIVSPTVTTAAATDIAETSATVGGNVTADGGATVTERGVYYSTSASPETTGTKLQIGSGTGTFSTSLTGLSAGTTYYIKAYATNSVGTAYGNEESFSTSQTIVSPNVTTSSATDIAETSATVGGNVTDDGGATVTERGVYYSTSASPETTGTKLQIGSGTGTFSTSLTGLSASTTYYIKAYATNSAGTAYGDEVNFTTEQTIVSPTVTTSSASDITETSATVGGNVTDDGGATVTERGVYYSTSASPETTGTKLQIGSGTGIFSTSLTGLSAGTTYYIKAYATNSIGTSYGSEKIFITLGTGNFTDTRDSHEYQWITIGAQVWMAENLAYLPSVSPVSSGSETEPYYYVYDYQGSSVSEAKATSNYTTYGVLYNVPATMAGASSSSANPSGVQGVCPDSWHLPSDAEWKQLEMFLGMSQSEADASGYRGTDEGSQLAGNASLWTDGNLKSDPAFGLSGFTALPGGLRFGDGRFSSIGGYGYWWSSTEISPYFRGRGLIYYRSTVFRNVEPKEYGRSVRCVRDY